LYYFPVLKRIGKFFYGRLLYVFQALAFLRFRFLALAVLEKIDCSRSSAEKENPAGVALSSSDLLLTLKALISFSGR
jgi:hypothetical protein